MTNFRVIQILKLFLLCRLSCIFAMSNSVYFQVSQKMQGLPAQGLTGVTIAPLWILFSEQIS